MAFAQSGPTPTPTPVPTPTPAALSWPQFRFNPQNYGQYQPFDNPYFQPKWQISLGQPNVSYSSPPVVLDLGTNSTMDGPPNESQDPDTLPNPTCGILEQ